MFVTVPGMKSRYCFYQKDTRKNGKRSYCVCVLNLHVAFRPPQAPFGPRKEQDEQAMTRTEHLQNGERLVHYVSYSVGLNVETKMAYQKTAGTFSLS